MTINSYLVLLSTGENMKPVLQLLLKALKTRVCADAFWCQFNMFYKKDNPYVGLCNSYVGLCNSFVGDKKSLIRSL
jgi:hypothetical protein